MITIIFAAAALLAEVTPAAPPPAAPPAAAATPVAKPDPRVNKLGLICRNEAVLGSRFPKKVCFTPADLAVRTQDDRADLDRAQSGHK